MARSLHCFALQSDKPATAACPARVVGGCVFVQLYGGVSSKY